MLYATTRSNVDIYTAQRVLKDDRAEDGALYVPMTLPPFMPFEIRQFMEKSPADVIAIVLNRFFNGTLTGKDVEFSAGKTFFSMVEMPYKLVIAELWHNPDGEVDWLVQQLAMAISGDRSSFVPGEWARIAIRIALLAAICGEMGRRGLIGAAAEMDVAVAAGDEASFLAAWYARRMGLPIHKVIVSCNANSVLWDFVNRGQVRCGGTVLPTNTPRYDKHGLDSLERLICASFGRVESNRFVTACKNGNSYLINSEQQRHLEEGMYISVIGSDRVERTIPNVYGSFSYVLDPYSALVYCGIMDYRAETGERNPVLMLSNSSPMNCQQEVTAAMGISAQELCSRLKLG